MAPPKKNTPGPKSGSEDAKSSLSAVRPQRLQLADIARLAGVSISTASRALSNNPLVSEKTRARVGELARSLNYTVNVGAQSLRLRQNTTVGVVLPFSLSQRRKVSDPFFLALIGSIATALTDRGKEMLLTRVSEDHLASAGQLYDAGRALGIIVIGQWHQHDQLNALAARQVPLVVWGAHLPQQLYCTVGSDNVDGGRVGTKHLLDAGRRRIAFLGDISEPEVAQRYDGYLKAHAACGVKPVASLRISTSFDADEARVEISRLVGGRTKFDGIFAASDVIAMTAISALTQAGLRVPQDVSVVGFDDIEMARHYHPSLSTVRQPIDEAGEAMVDALLDIVDGRKTAPRQLPAILIQRESSLPG